MKTKASLFLSLFFVLSCELADEGYYGDIAYDRNTETNGRERYNEYEENAFIKVADEPVSTFSIDADGASYSNVRRFLNDNVKPPKGAIRTEELINYFSYNYTDPAGEHPVSVDGEISVCPWNTENRLIRIGIKGKTLRREELPPANFVLLIDVSGSMSDEDKLPLLKKGFINFVREMRTEDRIAIVVYAGAAGVVLPSTSGKEKDKIIRAIESLGSEGSTAGAAGIITAYDIAVENKIEGGNNRVILGTDGDFNVGIYDPAELIRLIEEKRETGVFLTTLGYGTGNLNEGMMERLANNGNGNFEYIDNIAQSDKVFIHEYGKFYTVAKDVKVQVEFSPEMVEEYRLIGYENRVLENEDFDNDKKDAGEIGSGQCITALYEIKPVTANAALRQIPVFTINFRYKYPDEDNSNLITLGINNHVKAFENASQDMRFSASVAGFGLLLWDSRHKGDVTYEKVHEWAQGAIGSDPHHIKSEFLALINKAKKIR